MNITPIKKQSLHDDLVDQLRKFILSKQSGHRLESESVLAKRAGVSIVTLRNAMLLLEREDLIERTRGRGTFVKTPSPASAATGHIAIYCGPEPFQPRPSYFHLGAISALRRFFTEQNLMSQIYFGHQEIKTHQVGGPLVEAGDICPELTQAVANRQVPAAVFLCGRHDSTWARTLRAQNIPVVGGPEFGVGVTSDSSDLGRLGVRQLAERGCRRLALLGWSNPQVGDSSILLEGFREEVRRLGLPLNEGWIRHDLSPEDQGAGWEEFREIWISSAEKPDGLIVTDDMLLADAARAVTEFGINIPVNLRIVSHANRGACYPVPFPVDWMEYDPIEHGRTLGNQLLQLMRGEKPEPPVVTLRHRLVVGQSEIASGTDKSAKIESMS